MMLYFYFKDPSWQRTQYQYSAKHARDESVV